MVSVNLLPPPVRHARRRAQRIRRWSGVVAAAILLATIPVGIDAAKAARAATVERALAPLEGRLDEVRAKLSQAGADCTQLSTQVTRADALRAKRPWGGLLVAVAEQQPAEVWLTAVASKMVMEPRRPAAKGKAASPEDAVMALEGPRGLRLEGNALDHEWLYQFMTNLKQAELFNKVELSTAEREPVEGLDVVRFVVECDW